MRLYYALACAVLTAHALFIAWIIFGVAFTARRPLLRWLHITSLIWGVLIEFVPLPCPLTVAEQWLEIRAGLSSYHGSFLLHYLDKFVYPDVPPVLLTVAPVVVAIVNLGVYAQRFHRAREGKLKWG
jgi:hypothetical protein